MAPDPERQEIFELLGRALNEGRLPPTEEARLRRLMAPRNHAAPTLEWDELVRHGLFMVGVWLQFQPETLDVQA